MCGMFIHWAHQQVLLSSIASPHLIPKLSSTIWSAKGEASSFRVHCPQPPRLPVCRTWTDEPDWKLQEGRDAVSTRIVSLGPELDKQPPPGCGREEKTGPGHGCVVAKFTQPATDTSTVPFTPASLPPGMAHLHALEAPLCSSVHPQNRSVRGARPRARAGLCPGPLGPRHLWARVTCPQLSQLQGLAFVPGTGAKGKSLLNYCLQCRFSALAWATANPQQQSSLLSACRELILGPEPCLIHRLSCNSRSGSSHLQMETPLCSWRRPGSPLSEPFSHPPSLALPESETRPSSQEPHCPAWPVPHGPLHSPEQFHNQLLLDFPIWI